MFGRLPQLHRDVLFTVVVVTFTALGAWLFHQTAIPYLTSTGAVVGLAVGVVLAFVSVHPFHHDPPPVRVRRR